VLAVTRITTKTLRTLTTGLLSRAPYTMNKAS
jgi:hypothetical protein